MSKKVYKQMSIDVKAVDEEKFEVEGVFSTAKEDRHGEIVFQNWDLKPFKKNPVILNSHNYRDIAEVIGKAVKIGVKDNQLEGKIQFAVNENPKAKIAWELVKNKFVSAFSVGFIAREFDDKWNILKAELLEISLVSVPANDEALAKAKAFGIDVDAFLKEEEPPVKVEAEPIDDEDDEDDDGKDVKDHVVTEEDLKNNPELSDAGVEVGDTIQVPVEKEDEDDDDDEDEDDEDDEDEEDEEEPKPEPEKEPEPAPEPEPEPEAEEEKGIEIITQSLKSLASELKVGTLNRIKSEEVRANAKRLLSSAIRDLIKTRNEL